jgi:hypothetical protein
MTNTDIDKAGKVKPTLMPVMIACEQRYQRKKLNGKEMNFIKKFNTELLVNNYYKYIE